MRWRWWTSPRRALAQGPVGRPTRAGRREPDGKVIYVSNEAPSTATAVELAWGARCRPRRSRTEPEGSRWRRRCRVYVRAEFHLTTSPVLDARSGKLLGRPRGRRRRAGSRSRRTAEAFVTAEVGGTLVILDAPAIRLRPPSPSHGQTSRTAWRWRARREAPVPGRRPRRRRERGGLAALSGSRGSPSAEAMGCRARRPSGKRL